MGKAIGLLFAVAAIWITLEIYTQGTSNAFGGRFASLLGSGDAAPRGSAPQRAGAAVERAQREHEQRYDQLLPE
jgi:hypothetical protein